MPQIIPIKDLKNTSDISEMCHRTDEPIFVTKNSTFPADICKQCLYKLGL